MSSNWHYADRQQQQQGPVDAAWLQGAFARGEVTAATLVWREGMANWLPLAQVARELGIAAVAASPAMPPPRPPSAVVAGGRPVVVAPKGSPLLLVLVIVGVIVLFGGGILAAIAIPAYQDYVQRSKVTQAVIAGSAAKVEVEVYVAEHTTCPGNGDGGIGTPESYASGDYLKSVSAGELDDGSGRCALILTLAGVESPGDEHSVTMIRRGESDWVYRSTLNPRLLPASIRGAME